MMVHLTKREGGSSGAGFAWVDSWCGIEHGAVSSSDDVAKVDCKACLAAAAAFGDRCRERIGKLNAFGDYATPMARKLAEAIDAEILAELAELSGRNASMQWRPIKMHMTETAATSGEIERMAGEVDADIERLRVGLNLDIAEADAKP